MSKLYLNDLEKIKEGQKIVRYSLEGHVYSSSLVSLSKISNEIRELQAIRNFIIKLFEDDTKMVFDNLYGSKIHVEEKASLHPQKLFLDEYLSLIIPTILGDSHCLFTEDEMVSSTGFGRDLETKVRLIMPYVKKIFELKKISHLLDNDFYSTLNVVDENDDTVLKISGDGIVLPFNDYKELLPEDYRNLLMYYYNNWDKILKNVLVPTSYELDKYRLDINKEKALSIYKGL